VRRALRAAAPGLVVAALAAAPSGAGAATACPGADRTPHQLGTAATVAALVCLTNHERAAVGLRPLRVDGRLALAAQRHVDDMTRRGYFSHDAPLPAPYGRSPATRALAAGYAWGAIGENIAVGQQTPRWAVKDWLASKGHCESLLWNDVVDVGFGVSDAPLGDYPAPAWTQEVGRPLTTAAPGGPVPSCPRAPAVPAPVDGPAPAGEVAAVAAAPAGGTATTANPPATPAAGSGSSSAPGRLAASARRTGKRLRLRVRVARRSRTLLVRIRQGSVRTRRNVRGISGVHAIRLRRARGGSAIVGKGAGSVTIRFR